MIACSRSLFVRDLVIITESIGDVIFIVPTLRVRNFNELFVSLILHNVLIVIL